MSDDTEQGLREIIESRIKKQQSAIEDVIGVLVIGLLSWGAWVAVQPLVQALPAKFLAILALLLAGFTVFLGTYALWQLYEAFVRPRLDDSLRRRTEAELQRIQADILLEKAKRSHHRLALTEDGELLEIVDDDDELASQQGQ